MTTSSQQNDVRAYDETTNEWPSRSLQWLVNEAGDLIIPGDLSVGGAIVGSGGSYTPGDAGSYQGESGPSAAEFARLVGVTSPIQTQLAARLVAANNLSDLGSASAARTNLGLGTAAIRNTGTASGEVPLLGAGGKLASSVLPAIAITDTFVVASQAAMLALSAAETGDVAVRSDLNKSFILAGTNPATLSHWQELLTPTDSVLSVNGQTGAVVLTTQHITEHASNLYFTNARARLALSGTSNQVVYDNTTGVFALPQNIHTAAAPQFARLGLGVAADASTPLKVAGTAVDLLSLVGSNATRATIYLQASNTTSQANLYFENNRGSFASYGGVLYGGQTNAIGNIFGLSRADRMFVFADGASNLGFGLGTLTNQPVVFGVNNAEVARLTASGLTVTTALLSSSTTFSVANTTATTVNFAGAATSVNVGAAAGTITFAGSLLTPASAYATDLGQLTKKFRTLHAAELVVETLVSQETIATVGGRVVVTSSTSLIADLSAGATTIDVKHNSLSNGDRLWLEGGGQVEFIGVTSSATAIAGGYRYSISRNLDGTGANAWSAGAAVVNTGGASGYGWIDLYALQGMKGATTAGPTIVGNVRNSATVTDWSEHWAVGNLQGLYGYGATTFGAGFGKYADGNTFVTVDPSLGFRVVKRAGGVDTARIQLAADGSGFVANNNFSWTSAGVATISGWTINPTSLSSGVVKVASGEDVTGTAGVAEAWFGKAAAGYVGLYLKGTTAAACSFVANNSSVGTAGRPYFYIYDGSVFRVVLGELNTTLWDGSASNSMGMKVMDAAGARLVEFSSIRNEISGWAIATGAITSTGVALRSGASANIAFGAAPPTSSAAGTGVFIDASGFYGLATGVTQVKVDSMTGKLLAGVGAVVLDGAGISVVGTNSFTDARSYALRASDGTVMASLAPFVDASDNIARLGVQQYGTRNSRLHLTASCDSTHVSEIDIKTDRAGVTGGRINVSGNGSLAFYSGVTLVAGLGSSLFSVETNLSVAGNLDLNTTTGALLLPRLTTTQRDALTATNGMLIYNTTTVKFQGRAAGAWVDLH